MYLVWNFEVCIPFQPNLYPFTLVLLQCMIHGPILNATLDNDAPYAAAFAPPFLMQLFDHLPLSNSLHS